MESFSCGVDSLPQLNGAVQRKCQPNNGPVAASSDSGSKRQTPTESTRGLILWLKDSGEGFSEDYPWQLAEILRAYSSYSTTPFLLDYFDTPETRQGDC